MSLALSNLNLSVGSAGFGLTITGGSITYAGRPLQQSAPHEIVRLGVVQVPEGATLTQTETKTRSTGVAPGAPPTAKL